MQTLELSGRDYEIITIKNLKDLVEKMDHMCEEIRNFRGEMEMLKKQVNDKNVKCYQK